jgi:hypothetical protein
MFEERQETIYDKFKQAVKLMRNEELRQINEYYCDRKIILT